jgi:hypothetical protein
MCSEKKILQAGGSMFVPRDGFHHDQCEHGENIENDVNLMVNMRQRLDSRPPALVSSLKDCRSAKRSSHYLTS